MKVYKLWDNFDLQKFDLPSVFTPAPHKFTGTPIENLCELAGRVCYDSIDGEKGKDSKHYHAHIKEVKHDSIYGHAVINLAFIHESSWRTAHFVMANLSNRPGVFVTFTSDRLTTALVSLRAAIQWKKATSSGAGTWQHGPAFECGSREDLDFYEEVSGRIYADVTNHWARYAPNVIDAVEERPFLGDRVDAFVDMGGEPEQRWMSVYIEGVSRDLLQELVRHHYQTAPSVRSTRYCDESCSNFIAHPALDEETRVIAEEAAGQSRAAYSKIFAALKAKNTPLKVARGAARCVLPGGTETKLVYSASVKQWNWLASMRVHSAADLEIQNLAKECVKQLELN